jgi:hypothetical protein
MSVNQPNVETEKGILGFATVFVSLLLFVTPWWPMGHIIIAVIVHGLVEGHFDLQNKVGVEVSFELELSLEESRVARGSSERGDHNATAGNSDLSKVIQQGESGCCGLGKLTCAELSLSLTVIKISYVLIRAPCS